MASENQTVSEYIVHHLTNLTYGKLPGGFERHLDSQAVSHKHSAFHLKQVQHRNEVTTKPMYG